MSDSSPASGATLSIDPQEDLMTLEEYARWAALVPCLAHNARNLARSVRACSRRSW